MKSGRVLPPCTASCVAVAHIIPLIRETILVVVIQVLKYFLKKVLYYRFTNTSLVWMRDVNQQYCQFVNCSYFQNHIYCCSLTNYPKSSKNCWLQGLIQLHFYGIPFFLPTMITVLFFFFTVVKSPTNYLLSKLHVTVEFVLRLMYIKTSRVSQAVRVWMAVPLHLVPVLALTHAFPLFFWAPSTLYCCTARIGTDCCIMYAFFF